MSDEERLILKIDIDVMGWTAKETRLYRANVGVNPEYALGTLQRAAEEAAVEARAKFGTDPPPPDYMPLSLLNIDPGYLLGFAWIVARRSGSHLSYDDYSDTITTGALMRAFYGSAPESAGEPDPFEDSPPQPARKSSRTKSASASGSSSAGA